MKITSKIDAVTLFPRGAEITRLAQIELEEGEHLLVLTDLSPLLVESSLRVEGEADGSLELGAVDMRMVMITDEEASLEPDERRLLEQRIEKLEDEVRRIDGRMLSVQTRGSMMNNLAAMPVQIGAAQGQTIDWAEIYGLIGEHLPKVQGEMVALEIERREMNKKIDDLRNQLEGEPLPYDQCYEVTISVNARRALKGQLGIRYQVRTAGWQPFYDARLLIEADDGQPIIDLVRRSQVHQSSGEPWQDVELTLSTTRPSGGTSAPELASDILDIVDESPKLLDQLLSTKVVSSEAVQTQAMPEGKRGAPRRPRRMSRRRAAERETEIELSNFHGSFKVPTRVSLADNGETKKVRLGSERLKPRLQVRATPLIDETAFLYADFEFAGELALLPGEVALYRDNLYVGNGRLPLVNSGERHELGFGVDDKVTVKRVELKRAKGSHGLIKTENTDEFHFKITVNNHHKEMMPVRILDRIPVSNHEKLKVERLRDMSAPTHEDVDDKRGVLAYEFDLAQGGEEVLNIHYRLSWPKDERIG